MAVQTPETKALVVNAAATLYLVARSENKGSTLMGSWDKNLLEQSLREASRLYQEFDQIVTR